METTQSLSFRETLRSYTVAHGGTVTEDQVLDDFRKLHQYIQTHVCDQVSFFNEFFDRPDRGLRKILIDTAQGIYSEASSEYIFSADTYVSSGMTAQVHFASMLVELVVTLGLGAEVFYLAGEQPTDQASLKIKVFW